MASVAGQQSAAEKQQRMDMMCSEDEFILHLQLNKKGQGHALGPGLVKRLKTS